MLLPNTQCVVGIDVAKQAHVVCALEAPSGSIRHKPSRIEATSEGFTLLCSWLATWGAPQQIVIGLEATGPLREPLYERLTQAGYTVLDSSAQALAQVSLVELTSTLDHLSDGRWGEAQAQALQALAHQSTASSRALAARSLVARTLAQQLLELA